MNKVGLTSDFFKNNREKLKAKLKENSLVIVHSNDEMPRNGDQFFPFRQNSAFYYLTGIAQEKSIFCFAPDHANEKIRELVLILKADKSLEIWEGHKLTHKEAKEKSGIDTIKYIDDFEAVLRELVLGVDQVYVYQNEYTKFTTDVDSRNLRFARKLLHDYPATKLERLAPIVAQLRSVKEADEIAMIQHACNITKKAFHRVLSMLTPDIYEYEVEAELTHEFIRNGCQGHAYAPIIASGKNACVLHYVTNNDVCRSGDLLLMDFGAEYGCFAADCSRTIPVAGKFTERQKECYNAVLRVFEKAKQLFVPGNTISSVNKKVDCWMEEEMITLGLFSKEEVANQDENAPLYKNYYMHGTSHFLGLDVHDVGEKDWAFEKGMVLTCEPGIYIEGEGIGIRIENDIMVDDQPVDLMKDIPLKVEEIEQLLQKPIK